MPNLPSIVLGAASLCAVVTATVPDASAQPAPQRTSLLVVVVDGRAPPGQTLPAHARTLAETDALVFGAPGAASVLGAINENAGGRLILSPAAERVVRVTDRPEDAAFRPGGPAGITAAISGGHKYALRIRWLAQAAGVDFRRYDRDGNGRVDKHELVILAIDNYSDNAGQAQGGLPCVAHKDPSVELCADVTLAGHNGPLSLYTHELAHLFGLGDIYSNDCLSQGLSLASCTSPQLVHLDPVQKLRLGWTTASATVEADKVRPGLVSLRPASAGGRPLVIRRSPASDEAFYIEHRRNGLHDQVARDGIVVWFGRVNASGLVVEPQLGGGTSHAVYSLGTLACVASPSSAAVRGRGQSGWGPGHYRLAWSDGVDSGLLLSITAPSAAGDIVVSWARSGAPPQCDEPGPGLIALAADGAGPLGIGRIADGATMPGAAGGPAWRYVQPQQRVVGVGKFTRGGSPLRTEILVAGGEGLAVLDLRSAQVVHRWGDVLGAWTLRETDQLGPVADLDGDGRTDIVVRSATRLGVLRVGASGRLESLAVVSTGQDLGGWSLTGTDRIAAVADVDADTRAELIMIGDGGLAMLALDGAALRARHVLRAGQAVGAWEVPRQAEVLTVDLDGLPPTELVVRDEKRLAVLTVDRSRGPRLRDVMMMGEVRGPLPGVTGTSSWKLQPKHRVAAGGDLDGDGRGRLVVRGEDGLVLLGLRDRLFVDTHMNGVFQGYGIDGDEVLGFVDLDGDGRDNLLIRRDRWVGAFSRDRSGTWSRTSHHVGDLRGAWQPRPGDRPVAWHGDLDGDGRPELLLEQPVPACATRSTTAGRRHEVTITGMGDLSRTPGGVEVMVGGVRWPVVASHPDRVEVAIPTGAASGTLTVRSGWLPTRTTCGAITVR